MALTDGVRSSAVTALTAEDIAAMDEKDRARAEELRRWLARANERAAVVHAEWAQACAEANRVELALLAIERRIKGEALQ